MIHQLALHAANTSSFGSLLDLLDRAQCGKPGVLAALTYHRVDYAAQTPDLYPGLISATPERFAEQLDMLAELGQVVSMGTVLEAVRGQIELPARSILITFDDACQDFARYAWPALQARRMPVTVFVPTAYPDYSQRRFWWDQLYVAIKYAPKGPLKSVFGGLDFESPGQRDRVFRTLREHVKSLPHESAMQLIEQVCQSLSVPTAPSNVMSWEQLRQLARQGVSLAPHTQTHPLLNRVPLAQARDEICGALEDLRRELGDAVPVFAYPGGACRPGLAEVLRENGIELGFTVKRGLNDMRVADPLMLDRINVGQHTSTQVLRTQLLAGWWRHR